jgi:MFS family permease
MQIQNLKKLGLLGSLYVSQFMPFWFLFQALPVLLRQKGLSLEAIGFLPLITLPVTLKFLWSPLIDRYGFTRWGHYRFWIILFQLLVVGITIICSVLSIETHLPLVLIGLTLIAVACSSQDIATDALALGLLKPEERGFGNAVQAIGGSLGSMIGGGGMLILLNRWGWTASLLTLAAMMLVALIPVLLHREKLSRPAINGADRSAQFINLRSYFKIFLQFCQRPGIRTWLLILALYTAGHNLSATMFRPLLVDLGLSLEDVGWLLGIFGTMINIFGALVAGILITKVGRKRSLLTASSLATIGALSYFLPTFGFTQLPVLYFIVSMTFFSLGMMVATSFTIMMDKSRQSMAGTDYSLQASIIPLGSIIAAVFSGVIAGAIGYRGVFTLSVVLILCCILLIAKFIHLSMIEQYTQEDYHHAHNS